jgi:hypothetical protein
MSPTEVLYFARVFFINVVHAYSEPIRTERAEHYGTAILSALPLKPGDQAHVETGVQTAERQLLAPLGDRRFFAVGELNQAIRPLQGQLNEQPFQKLEGSRNRWFEAMEKDKLLALPAQPFELATWGKAKANIDYYVVTEKLQALRREGMAQALEEQSHQADISQLDFEGRPALLVERQWLWEEERALAARLHNAQADGSLMKLLKNLARTRLLVIDGLLRFGRFTFYKPPALPEATNSFNQRLRAASTSLMTRATNFPAALRTNSVNFTGWMLWTLTWLCSRNHGTRGNVTSR